MAEILQYILLLVLRDQMWGGGGRWEVVIGEERGGGFGQKIRKWGFFLTKGGGKEGEKGLKKFLTICLIYNEDT